MLEWIPDSLVLKPSNDPLATDGTERQQLDTPVGPCGLWVRPANGSPDLILVKIPGAGGRAERAVAQPPGYWDDLRIETIALNPPGYGDSPGKARLRNVVPCAHAVLQHAMQRNLPVVLAGNSLGGLAALLTAGDYPLRGLIVRNPPPLRRVIRGRTAWWNGWIGAFLIAGMVPGQLERHECLQRLQIPAIFIRSLEDRVVPAPLQQPMIDAYAGPKRQLDLPGADHDTTMEPDQQAEFLGYMDWLREQGAAG